MTGIELLEQARRHAPDAKLLLLTAYADTDVAIKAINDIGLDYYLLKPWDPPEERLYPVIDDLLDDWRQGPPGRHRRRAGGRAPVVGPQPRAEDVPGPQPRALPLVDVERDEEARAAARRSPAASRDDLPLVLVPDGEHAARPVDARAGRARSGCAPTPSSRSTTCASSAAARPGWPPRCTPRPRGCSTVIVEREAPGGQAGQSAAIENYLGFPKGLSRRRPGPAGGGPGGPVRRRDGAGPRRRRLRGRGARCAPCCFDGGGEIEARAVVVATGVSYRRLEAPGLERAHRPRRLLRRDRQRGGPVRGRRRLRRRRRPTPPARRR